ncbi:hypothetical protein REPUB_Repub02eG0054800 [Reevesia pubescens]
MVAPLLLKGMSLLRLRLQQYNHLTPGILSTPRRAWKWKDKKAEILRDIEPIISLTKEILHSDRLVS